MKMDRPRAAIYCRLSEEDRDKGDEESESIQNQKTMLLRYAAESGWNVVDFYCDEDYTGADRSRPAFNRLLCDAKNGAFEIVLCKSQSRFTRELELVEKYLHGLFPKWGIRFIGYADHADTANRGNKKARQINGLVNEWYLEDLSDNIRSVVRSKQQTGRFIGSFAPYGYRKCERDKNLLIPDEEAAQIVCRIFMLREQGMSLGCIAEKLNEAGIVNPSTYKKQRYHGFYRAGLQHSTWSASTVRTILENPVYCGDLRQHIREKISYKSDEIKRIPQAEQIIVKNTHQAIVSREQWERVQVQGSRMDIYHPHNNKRAVYYCGICRKSLYTKYSHGKRYFVCRDHHVSVREERIAELWPESVVRDSEFACDDSVAAKKAEQIQDKIRMAYDDMLAGIIHREQFERMNREWQKQWNELMNNVRKKETQKKDTLNRIALIYPGEKHRTEVTLHVVSLEALQKSK